MNTMWKFIWIELRHHLLLSSQIVISICLLTTILHAFNSLKRQSFKNKNPNTLRQFNSSDDMCKRWGPVQGARNKAQQDCLVRHQCY